MTGRTDRGGRQLHLDYLKGVSVVYITGFWHLLNYVDPAPTYVTPATYLLTVVVLSVFTFVSGYLAGGALERNPSIATFYRKRWLRIYPLYAAAVLLFVGLDLMTGRVGGMSLLLVAMLVPPAPPTLWFITMLLLFVLLTPALYRVAERPWGVGGVVAVTVAALAVVSGATRLVDERLILYLPVYAGGIACARHGVTGAGRSPAGALATAAVLGCGYAVLEVSPALETWLLMIIGLSGAYGITAWMARREAVLPAWPPILGLSYAGYVIYLVHRPVYHLAAEVGLPASPAAQILVLALWFLLVVVPLSWAVQTGYDRIIPRLTGVRGG